MPEKIVLGGIFFKQSNAAAIKDWAINNWIYLQLVTAGGFGKKLATIKAQRESQQRSSFKKDAEDFKLGFKGIMINYHADNLQELP